jgi:cation-transporting ATPase F
MQTPSRAAPHALPLHEVFLLWETDPTSGLTDEEAQKRLARYGPNELPEGDQRGAFVTFLLQFNSPLIYVLLGASIVTAAVQEWIDTGVILAVVVVNAIVGYIQERRASRALEALAEMTQTQAVVMRAGRRTVIDSRGVVPGDLIVLEAGDKVPADLRLIDVHDLRVDESALTGESMPVDKSQGDVDPRTGLADRFNMTYSSTLVTAGNARGVAVETGATTEIGQIHRLVGQSTGVQTPLTRRLARFGFWLTIAILILTALTFVLGLMRGLPLAEMVTSAVAIAVAAIPEGLPAVVTITLAIGVSRMAKRNAIIRHLPAVETLGSTTVICTDKTGTLTQNRMTVQFITNGLDEFDVREHIPPEVRGVLEAGVLCNNASNSVGDPTEMALVHIAERASIDRSSVMQAWPRTDEIPFTSDLRYMATAHSGSTGSRILVKGAVEAVLDLCEIDADEAERVHQLVATFSASALRVLAFASADTPAPWSLTERGLTELPLTFMGLQAMADPPRPDAIRAIQVCHGAGINVKMITGDHALTAQAIAHEMGLSPSTETTQVLTGVDIAAMDRAELADALRSVDVIARVSAEQKLLIVEALQDSAHVVAMTGDGINDAPALKQADIGVAMGEAGTEVAKEAAAMVLTDDNFASIEAAVEEGRGVFANLTKFITFALPTNLGQALIIMVAILAGLTLPILPVQILWVNMTTAVALGLTLAFEPTEDATMQQPPRRPGQSIIGWGLLIRMILVGVLMLIGAYVMFEMSLNAGLSLETARTGAVTAVIAMQIGYLFNCRSLDRSVFSIGLFSNPSLLWGIGIMIALSLAFAYLPVMHLIFDTAPMTADQWFLAALLAFAVVVIVGAEKFVSCRIRNFRQSTPGPNRPTAEATTRHH